jgi:hypothetical protein
MSKHMVRVLFINRITWHTNSLRAGQEVAPARIPLQIKSCFGAAGTLGVIPGHTTQAHCSWQPHVEE